MHDVVRDFAHWITSTGEKMFMVKNELTEWPNSENFDCYTAISLWNSKIDNFPERLEFSKLKTLILSGRDYQIVPSTFFEGMKALQILFLERHVFSMEAFQFLKNLRILRIVRCGLQEDISSLRNLKNLEFLEWNSVHFEELPEELLELRRLKSLYFSCFGDGPINVPPNLLSRLTSLQELHVPRDNNANLLELNSLSRLTTLTLIVSTDQCFQENFVFPKLQSYSIAVNAYIEFPEKRISRILTISDCSSLNAFKELFPNVQKLTLFKVMEHKTVVPNVDQWELNELTSLQLTSCDDLECLIDTTWEQSPTTAFSNLVNLDIGGKELECLIDTTLGHVSTNAFFNLVELVIEEMTGLKMLCNGQFPKGFLQKLEKLTTRNCMEMVSLSPALQNLKEVKVINCGQLQEVFQIDEFLHDTKENQGLLLSNLTLMELNSLPALENIWKEPTHLVSLQSLKDVKVDGCDKLKSIFSPCLTQSLLHLEQLKISACKKLEQVFAFAQDMAEFAVPLISPSFL
ncbi:Disease resistance RPH8A-like protein [Theobroma cacao]|uniref:Disease resistance RPH8A-like protein n=1 Tax=Theobroma cacao TaxID=3641 RepID=A0A061F5S7_THECC|nr:Disease resistance RPH8A-like protein [Theobroma cacao]